MEADGNIVGLADPVVVSKWVHRVWPDFPAQFVNFRSGALEKSPGLENHFDSR
jgi:hypothetical protein